MSSSACPICLGRFDQPVLASCCGQSFCQACLDAALLQVDACPMCRSPLLSGPFSATPNRALEEALRALAPSSPRATSTEERSRLRAAIAEKKLLLQRSSKEVHVRLDSDTEDQSSLQDDPPVRGRLREWRMQCVALCRRVGSCRVVSSRSLQLRRQLRQWLHWCRVHWSSLQCVFYVGLFFVFVFFLRVQEEEFANNNLRRPD